VLPPEFEPVELLVLPVETLEPVEELVQVEDEALPLFELEPDALGVD
jgi:hypothetical protein